MKKKINFKNFIIKKKVAAGCIVAAAIITAGSFAMLWQPSDIPELTDYTDPVIETTITGDDTPLASQPKVTTKTSTSTKTSKKTVRLKKAAKKTYTKKLPTQTKKSTKITKKNSTTTVKTEKTVKTATTEKYTKKSKKKVVTTKVTTTVVQQIAGASNEDTTATGTSSSSTAGTGTSGTKKYTVSNVASIAPKMDSRVLNAYTKMGFSVIVDPSVSYAGHFVAKSRTITLQEADNTIYHELGHFLAFIAGNVDQSSDFVSVYNSEKTKYTGDNKIYAVQSASEFFAECVRDYCINPSRLQSTCPKTYKAIESALSKVTDARINMIMKVYAPVWK